MPRTAAILFGVVLVASSIGFNVTRYPAVWQMVGPSGPVANPAEATPPSVPPTTEASTIAPPEVPKLALDKATTPPESAPVREPVKPVPEVADRIALSPIADPAATQPAQAVSPPADNGEKSVEQRPLVPVPVAIGENGRPNAAGFDASVRRLPPVDESAPAFRSVAQSSDGGYPIYPSTGIQ